MKRLISLLLCMSLLICIVGCGQQASTDATQQSESAKEPSENVVKIGVLNPFTGGSAF